MTKIAQQRTKDVDFIIFWTVEKLSRFPDEIFKFFSENTTLLQKFCAGKTMQKSTYCMLHHFAPQTFLFSFFSCYKLTLSQSWYFAVKHPQCGGKYVISINKPYINVAKMKKKNLNEILENGSMENILTAKY